MGKIPCSSKHPSPPSSITVSVETPMMRRISRSKSTKATWLKYFPTLSRSRVEKYTRTRSSSTSVCGDCANSTQRFGSTWSVGSKIRPSLDHFIFSPFGGLFQHRQSETRASHFVALVKHIGAAVEDEDVRV